MRDIMHVECSNKKKTGLRSVSKLFANVYSPVLEIGIFAKRLQTFRYRTRPCAFTRSGQQWEMNLYLSLCSGITSVVHWHCAE